MTALTNATSPSTIQAILFIVAVIPFIGNPHARGRIRQLTREHSSRPEPQSRALEFWFTL
jgi:hypothetical protein